MQKKLVLVGCEFSGIVRDAFIKEGHTAWSCDLISSENPGPHIQADIFIAIKQYPWDMMIVFPPCTHLSVSGARWWKNKQKEQQESLEFIRKLLEAPINQIALENPIGAISTHIRQPNQIIHPNQFGDSRKKPICLWLKNLPLLRATNWVLSDEKSFIRHMSPSINRPKERSRFFPKIAEAMAKQWGNYVIK